MIALPLEPETVAVYDETPEPEFVRSAELEQLARSVMARYDEFDSLVAEVRGDDASIAITYVFETKPWDPETEELKTHTFAKVTKASPLWRCIADTHVVMQFRRHFWDVMTEEQREAVVWHELAHIEVRGPGKVRLKEHEIEEFAGVYRHFGAILPGRRGVLDAFEQWQRSHRVN